MTSVLFFLPHPKASLMFDSSLLFFHLLLFLRLVCTPPESDGIPYLSGQKNQINNVVDGTILIPCIILNIR